MPPASYSVTTFLSWNVYMTYERLMEHICSTSLSMDHCLAPLDDGRYKAMVAIKKTYDIDLFFPSGERGASAERGVVSIDTTLSNRDAEKAQRSSAAVAAPPCGAVAQHCCRSSTSPCA